MPIARTTTHCKRAKSVLKKLTMVNLKSLPLIVISYYYGTRLAVKRIHKIYTKKIKISLLCRKNENQKS